MQKETFIAAINAVKEQMDKDKAFAESIAKFFPNSNYVDLLYDNATLQTALINALKETVGDKDDWIEYFMWELDFGAENWRLKVTQDGQEIPLSTPEDLYNLITKPVPPGSQSQWDK